MVDDPRTVREVNLVVGAIKEQLGSLTTHIDKQFEAVNRRFKSLNQRIYWIAGLLVGGLLGGISLHVDVAKVTQRVEDLVKVVEGDKKQIDALQNGDTDWQKRLLVIATNIQDRLPVPPGGRILPPPPPSFTPLVLDEESRDLIRKVLGVSKKGGKPLDVKLGELAPSSVPLFPIPGPIFKAIPALVGYRFFADESNGTAVLVRPDGRVAAIV